MHKPVLLKEVLQVLNPEDGKVYIDATFGAGGYTKAILNCANCKVHAIDQDPDTKVFYQQIKKEFENRVFFSQKNFSKIADAMPKDAKVDGIVFDIGTSTMQLKTPERGFSFTDDGPLDMRMTKSGSIDAAMIVNSFPEKKIADILYNFGGERNSRKIAKAILNARHKKEIKTTVQLASIVHSCFPRRYYKIDPATKTFQALRIFVNDELTELKKGLDSALKMIKAKGKIIVVTFHSLEDKIAKEAFKSLDKRDFARINKKVITPTKEELFDNQRSRSAKLRAVLKL